MSLRSLRTAETYSMLDIGFWPLWALAASKIKTVHKESIRFKDGILRRLLSKLD